MSDFDRKARSLARIADSKADRALALAEAINRKLDHMTQHLEGRLREVTAENQRLRQQVDELKKEVFPESYYPALKKTQPKL